MMAQARFKSFSWMLLAVLVLAPTTVLAQQDNASQGENQQERDRPKAAQARTEEAETKTEGAQAQAQTEKDPKVISGMSILGNQEAPKALVIVPWKRSGLGNGLSISTMLDDSKLPIDKEVFMRMLSYYEIRSGTAPVAAPAETNAAPPASAAQRRKP